MTVFITGVAGFIGSHLAERYLNGGARVVGLDDLSTGLIDNLPLLHPHFRFVRDTVLNEAVVDDLVRCAAVVVHLAAIVGVARVTADTLRCWETNFDGTRVVLKAAARYKTRCLIASSSEVYGFEAEGALREDSDLRVRMRGSRRAGYAASKTAAEMAANALFDAAGLPVSILRFFNTIGPRQRGDYGMVVPRLIGQALSGVPLTVIEPGSQSRCFCDVDDLTACIQRLAGSEAAIGETINVGSDRQVSIGQLARVILRMTGSASPIIHLTARDVYGHDVEDYPRRMPDLQKLERLAGFVPAVDLETTLARTIDWCLRKDRSRDAAVA